MNVDPDRRNCIVPAASTASFFSVSISDSPAIIEGYAPVGDIKEEDVQQVKQWVLKNKQTLLAVWHQEVDIGDAKLQPIAAPSNTDSV
jgi:hypothetical protein